MSELNVGRRPSLPSVGADLAEQREDALRRLVGLREHARAGLLQDVQLRELRHLRRHVHVADTRLGRRQVLLVGRQVGQTVLEAVLDRAEVGAGRRDVLDRVVDRRRSRRAPPVDSAVGAAPRSAMAVSSDRPPAPTVDAAEVGRGRRDRLAVVGADLERERRAAPNSGLAVELRSGRRCSLISLGDLADLGRDRVLVVGVSVPLSNCTFRSRTRCSIECTSLSAPSAVWTSEMPSCALRCAWARPPI